MASEFYQITGGDEALLVGPGQAHCRKLGIASAALNMRVGFMLSFCKTDDKNNALAAAQSDSISLSEDSLGLMVGLRNYGTGLLNAPGQYFFGVGTKANTVSGQAADLFTSAIGLVPYVNGALQGTTNQTGVNLLAAKGAECAYIGMKLSYAQSSRAYLSLMKGLTYLSPSRATLETLLMNHSQTAHGETSSAVMQDIYPHLDSIYIQNPFVNCYIRVHAYGFMMDS